MRKIKAYSSKSQCLFSADTQYDMEFEGKFTPQEIQNTFGLECKESETYSWDETQKVSIPSPTAEWLGNLFLANTPSKLVSLIHSEKDDTKCSIVEKKPNFNESVFIPMKFSVNHIKKTEFICLSGDVLNDPESLGEIGREFQFNRFFVPEIKSAVSAIGALVNHLASLSELKPYRSVFFKENRKDLDFEFKENNCDKVKHDAAGNMAFMICQKSIGTVFNDVIETPSSSFFGKCISSLETKIERATFFTHETFARDFFEEPESSFYIAKYLPVRMKLKDEFKKEAGLTQDEANIRLININDNEHLLAFYNFYSKLSQKKVFQVFEPKDISSAKMVLFRYNKSYLVPSEFIKENCRSIT